MEYPLQKILHFVKNIDNDEDGLVDESQNNGIDDDGDGLVDCYDPDCKDSSNCANFFLHLKHFKSILCLFL